MLKRSFSESFAKQEKEQSSNNAVVLVEGTNARGNEDGNEEVALTGPVKEVTAQTGGNANLPCKFADAGGATVSI